MMIVFLIWTDKCDENTVCFLDGKTEI